MPLSVFALLFDLVVLSDDGLALGVAAEIDGLPDRPSSSRSGINGGFRGVFLGLLVLLGGLVPEHAPAQLPETQKGLVWTIPSEMEAVEADMERFQRMGVTVLRTGLVERERVLRLADSAGLALYQDLPIAGLPAASLQDTLMAVEKVVRQAIMLAQGHPSATHLGLCLYCDTSDPRSCSYFTRLTNLVHANAENIRTYYLSPFVTTDRCGASVDHVLLSGQSDSVGTVRWIDEWTSNNPETPVGLGSVGMGVFPDQASGYRTPHSEEAQARYIENHIRRFVLQKDTPTPASFFVYRWRDRGDRPIGMAVPGRNIVRSQAPSYRIHGRPAERVVQGMYTGEQTVFGFEPGESQRDHGFGFVLFGWGLVVGFALLVAGSPRIRGMIPRYFRAHRFYQEAVRRGREVVPVETTVGLLVIAGAAGLAAAVGIYHIRDAIFFQLALGWCPPAIHTGIEVLSQNPWMTLVLISCILGLVLLGWAGWLMVVARRYRPFIGYDQTLMIAVWPHWLFLLVGVGAWSAVQGDTTAGLLIAIAAFGALVIASIRACIDFVSITNAPLPFGVVAFVTSPAVIFSGVLLVLLESFTPEAVFLWHLITRM